MKKPADDIRRKPVLWLNVGEASGDQHAALLIRALRKKEPEIDCLGMGGSAMREQGFQALLRSEDLSVMGFSEVFGSLPRILGMLRRIRAHLVALRPDGVILVDAPEFNFRVARMARNLSIPVIYYISPKIWAWRTGRVEFIRRYVDRMICILPFEQEFYARHGIQVDYVGHPFVDSVRGGKSLDLPRDPDRICLLPGSRKKELARLMPLFADTAVKLSARFPKLRFVLCLAPNLREAEIRACWPEALPLEIIGHDRRYEVIRGSSMALAASGTVTLETALLETPTVVAYKLSWLTGKVGRTLIKSPYAALPNLVLGREIYPEFLQERATALNLAGALSSWIEHPAVLESVRSGLGRLVELLGPPGAVDRASRLVLETVRR